jgi:hypothetical protein
MKPLAGFTTRLLVAMFLVTLPLAAQVGTTGGSGATKAVAAADSDQDKKDGQKKENGDAIAECADDRMDPAARQDDRCDFEASFYVGRVIDSFAAQEYNNYVNGARNQAQTTRESYVGGVDFNYRVHRSPSGRDLWVFGETVHGVRSADVDCKANKDIELCSGKATSDQQFLYILRNARSVESYAGVRYEIPLQNPRGGNMGPARLFIASQLGFITVAGIGGDLIDNHTWVSVGVLNVNGRFSNSYLQAGIGKTDLFHQHRNARFKVDGFLSMKFLKSDVMRPFLQMTVDSDGRGGSDSVQSYFGLDVNFGASLVKLFGK